jgi:glycosyltransferase involved in cell wall biosynthesis
MIRLFLNGIAASAGAGLTYLRNVIPHLAQRSDAQVTVLLSSEFRKEFAEYPQIQFFEMGHSYGVARRFLFEQTELKSWLRRSGAQVLLSPGNFALRGSPVPQILLSGNSLYISADFYRDLRQRREYLLWADTRIKGLFARRSVHWADVTVAPSAAFAEALSEWTRQKVLSLHHGFDRDLFTQDCTPLPDVVQSQLNEASDALKLLFVSHYNYYRNFETLLRALPILQSRLPGKKIKLFLTCELSSRNNSHSYRTEVAAKLADDMGVRATIAEVGPLSYRLLHQLYRGCDIYVSPAYTETFAHPLVEAMASGLPVVASDLKVHREVCRDAAIYFPAFSPEQLADQIIAVNESRELAQHLARKGITRARDFSWSEHVTRLLAVANDLVQQRSDRR